MNFEQRYRSQFRTDAPKGDYRNRFTPRTADQVKRDRHVSQFGTWPKAAAAPSTEKKPTKKGK